MKPLKAFLSKKYGKEKNVAKDYEDEDVRRKQFVRCKIRLCHTAAILSRETKKALFYHAEPRSQNRGGEAKRGKSKLFGLPGQYGRRVTKANDIFQHVISFWEGFTVQCMSAIS